MPLLARITLWAWVVVAGVLLGGGIFETVVLTPLWAGSPPRDPDRDQTSTDNIVSPRIPAPQNG